MRRTRPHVTGIAVGLALSAWLVTREGDPGPRKAVRGVFAGIGAAVLLTHLLQRMDESGDSRRSYRHAKTRYLESLAASVTNSIRTKATDRTDGNSPGDSLDWLTDAPDSAILSKESLFEDELANEPAMSDPEIEAPTSLEVPPEPRIAFESAMADGAWNEAFDALLRGRDSESAFEPALEVQTKLRKAAMEEIFHRMHSGTVREDVARLAQAVVDVFPESTEGRTLAQVLGVLRRSAGLCPRCSRPYRGIAAACHDCLRGTPEAYQIAWDEDSDETGGAD